MAICERGLSSSPFSVSPFSGACQDDRGLADTCFVRWLMKRFSFPLFLSVGFFMTLLIYIVASLFISYIHSSCPRLLLLRRLPFVIPLHLFRRLSSFYRYGSSSFSFHPCCLFATVSARGGFCCGRHFVPAIRSAFR
jgi:hypothetical protein